MRRGNADALSFFLLYNGLDVKGACEIELLDGRPANVEGWLPREVRTYDLLDSLGIEYKRKEH